jgi:hypothetical protein
MVMIHFLFTGNSRKWICIKSTTTTKTKTHDSSTSTSCNAYSIIMALLCSGWTLFVWSNMENSSSSTSKSTSIVSFSSLFNVLFFYFTFLLYFEFIFSTFFLTFQPSKVSFGLRKEKYISKSGSILFTSLYSFLLWLYCSRIEKKMSESNRRREKKNENCG